jgi:hypothetical protein
MLSFLSREALFFNEVELNISTDGFPYTHGQQIKGKVNNMIANG